MCVCVCVCVCVKCERDIVPEKVRVRNNDEKKENKKSSESCFKKTKEDRKNKVIKGEKDLETSGEKERKKHERLKGPTKKAYTRCKG